MAEEQTVNQHLPNLQFVAPLNMGSANQRTTSKLLTNKKLTTREQEAIRQSQCLGCEKAYKVEARSLAACAHKLHTPLAQLILQCVS